MFAKTYKYVTFYIIQTFTFIVTYFFMACWAQKMGHCELMNESLPPVMPLVTLSEEESLVQVFIKDTYL